MEKQIYDANTLENFLSGENTCVILKNVSTSAEVHPFYLNNLKKGLWKALHQKLKQYDTKLGGLLLGYKNVKIEKDNLKFGRLASVVFQVHCDCYVFQPAVGCVIEGIVNKISPDHIGCIVHQYFNATIPRPADEDQETWSNRDINFSEKIAFRVKDLDFTALIPIIEGSLLDRENNACPENGFTGISDINVKDRKRKLEFENSIISSTQIPMKDVEVLESSLDINFLSPIPAYEKMPEWSGHLVKSKKIGNSPNKEGIESVDYPFPTKRPKMVGEEKVSVDTPIDGKIKKLKNNKKNKSINEKKTSSPFLPPLATKIKKKDESTDTKGLEQQQTLPGATGELAAADNKSKSKSKKLEHKIRQGGQESGDWLDTTPLAKKSKNKKGSTESSSIFSSKSKKKEEFKGGEKNNADEKGDNHHKSPDPTKISKLRSPKVNKIKSPSKSTNNESSLKSPGKMSFSYIPRLKPKATTKKPERHGFLPAKATDTLLPTDALKKKKPVEPVSVNSQKNKIKNDKQAGGDGIGNKVEIKEPASLSKIEESIECVRNSASSAKIKDSISHIDEAIDAVVRESIRADNSSVSGEVSDNNSTDADKRSKKDSTPKRKTNKSSLESKVKEVTISENKNKERPVTDTRTIIDTFCPETSILLMSSSEEMVKCIEKKVPPKKKKKFMKKPEGQTEADVKDKKPEDSKPDVKINKTKNERSSKEGESADILREKMLMEEIKRIKYDENSPKLKKKKRKKDNLSDDKKSPEEDSKKQDNEKSVDLTHTTFVGGDATLTTLTTPENVKKINYYMKKMQEVLAADGLEPQALIERLLKSNFPENAAENTTAIVKESPTKE